MISGWMKAFCRPSFPVLTWCLSVSPIIPPASPPHGSSCCGVAEQCSRCGALFMLDECFGDFLEEPEIHTLKNSLAEFPNLVILKAFTKLYAMAGVRLGYALCANGELVEKMKETGQPWAVSSLAQAAGEVALDETAYVESVRRMVMEERPWMMSS